MALLFHPLHRQGLTSGAIKNLDVEFTIMARDIKLPEGGSGLEAAAAAYGAQRAAATAPSGPPQAPAAPAEASGGPAEHSFGVDPVVAADMGETREQREEDVRQQQRQLEEEDDEDELC